jgi:D-glycero-D-manno-heptose 1,7-bisphosphate phosphatase
MLYLFDLDGTLITSYMDNPNKEYDIWELLPNRIETITALSAVNNQIGIITNQTGVGYGFINEDQAQTKLIAVAKALGFGTVGIHSGYTPIYRLTGLSVKETKFAQILPIFVCYEKSSIRRKPNGTMIDEAQEYAQPDYFNETMENFEDVPTLYIGDRSEDEAAAKNADVNFQWADDFFKL